METPTTNGRAGGHRRSWLAALRRFATFAMLLVALAALAAALVVHHLDETIRAHVERKLSEQFPDLRITIRSARRLAGQGIELRGVMIRQPDQPGRRGELVYVDEMLAVCPTDLRHLLRGGPTVTRLEIRRLRLRAIRGRDGRWNLRRLLPLPRLGACKPPAVIEDAVLEILDERNPEAGQFVVRQVNLRVTPQVLPATRGEPAGESAAEPTGEAAGQAAGESAAPPREVLRVVGSLVGEHFKQVRLRGEVDPLAGHWSVRGHVEQLEMSSRLLSTLPGELASQLAPLATLRARADLDFHVGSPLAAGQLPRFVLSGRLSEGRFDDERLPYPLTDLRADLYCDTQGLKIDNLRARSGRTTLQLSFDGRGYAKDSPYTVRAAARHLILDRRLYETLPAKWREAWDRYSLDGTINVDAVVRFDGREMVPDVIVECLDLNFAVDKFPYPMRRGQGTIRLRETTLSTDNFRAQAGSHWVHLSGRVENPGPDWTGWLEAAADGPVPIDEVLLAALDDDAARVVRSLRPTGLIRLVHARHERDQADEEPRQELELELSDVTIAYEKFPYPIHRIQGKLHRRDREWTFRDLVGRNDTAYIVCDGRYVDYPDQGGRLTLDFDCRAVPLEDELKQALEPGGRQLWEHLRPRGTIDQLNISLAFDSRRDELDVDVRGQQWPPTGDGMGRSLSLFPTFFPYRLDNLAGSVRYREGTVEIHELRALHGRTQLRMAGTFTSSRESPWQLELTRLTADGLHPDRDLIAALPERLGQALADLQLKGLLSLRGAPSDPAGTVPAALAFQGGGPDELPVSARWNLALDIENGSLDCGLDLEHIRGGLSLNGQLDEQGFQTRGELAIDSALLKDVHVTQIRGPLWMDSSHLRLGDPPARSESGPPPRPISGRVFGGELLVRGQAELQAERAFAIDVAVADADLAALARELMPRQRNLTGQAIGRLQLRGQAERPHTYTGEGSVRLRNADIYELPLMVALLKLLSVRRPDKTAFTTSNIDFRVRGEDIYFDPIDFRGDAISLIGKGTMNLDQAIQLTFYTQVGRREFPLLGSVLAEASRNILEIQVVGTLDEPVVQQTAFPELDETLQLLFPDARRRAEQKQARRWWSPAARTETTAERPAERGGMR